MSNDRMAVGSIGTEGSVEGGRVLVAIVEMKETRAASSCEGVSSTGEVGFEEGTEEMGFTDCWCG